MKAAPAYEFLQMTMIGHKGLKALEENQDRVLLRPLPIGDTELYLLAVADGVSRCPDGGAVAEYLVTHMACDEPLREKGKRWPQQLRDYLRDLNIRFYSENIAQPEMLESACTLSAALLEGECAHCLWAGDSPIFRARPLKGRWQLRQISVPDLVDRFLSDCFGAHAPFRLKYRKVRLASGDVLIVATDGVVPTVEAMAALLDQHGIGAPLLDAIQNNAQAEEYYDDASLVLAQRTC